MPPRANPRISANDLAQYMVSSETAKIGIIRRSKFPQPPPVIRYRDVRPILCAYLSDLARNLNPLLTAEEMFTQRSQDPAESALRRDDALNSIEVLHAVQRMGNKLNLLDFRQAPQNQRTLSLGGVEVSIRADLLVFGASRSGDLQMGAALLRMTQDDADTDTAKERRREMGLYVATLVRLHVDQNLLIADRAAVNRLCMSIDVQHGEAFQAPPANTRRANDLENACRFIAAMWPGIQP